MKELYGDESGRNIQENAGKRLKWCRDAMKKVGERVMRMDEEWRRRKGRSKDEDGRGVEEKEKKIEG